jgi:hypothetical protein
VSISSLSWSTCSVEVEVELGLKCSALGVLVPDSVDSIDGDGVEPVESAAACWAANAACCCLVRRGVSVLVM